MNKNNLATLNEHARQQLILLIGQYGYAIFSEPKRCEAMLRDLCPKHRREVNLLMIALKEKVVEDLLNRSPNVPVELSLQNLSNRLHDNLGIAQNFADWVVESWALALEVIQEPVLSKKTTPDNPAPQAATKTLSTESAPNAVFLKKQAPLIHSSQIATKSAASSKPAPAQLSYQAQQKHLSARLIRQKRRRLWIDFLIVLVLGVCVLVVYTPFMESLLTIPLGLKTQSQPHTSTDIHSKSNPAKASQQIGKFMVQEGTASDTQTGLTWLRFAYGQSWKNGRVVGSTQFVSWYEAVDVAERFNQQGGYAGFTDWRVPAVNELKTLIDYQRGKPANFIDTEAFPNNYGEFWTSSPIAFNGYSAVIVSFSNGENYGNNKKNLAAVRLVRSRSQ